MKFILVLFILVSQLLSEETFQNYLQKHNKYLNKYQYELEKKYENYQSAYETSLEEYKKSILDKWPKAEISSSHKWVEYTKNYKAKKVINFEKEQLQFEIIAKHEKEALVKIIALFEELDTYSVSDIYKNDALENKIANKLDIAREPLESEEELISDLLTNKQQKRIIEALTQQKLKNVSYKGNEIFIARIKLPKNSLTHKIELYREIIAQQYKKHNLPQELIYAIIHAKSSFNPLSRSETPQYGLMQLDPKKSALDAYFNLYGQKKNLKPHYLYNPSNNIMLGSNYLKILHHETLKDITDEKTRLQCTIIIYNIGFENLINLFSEQKNTQEAINNINNMSSDQVYKRLLRKLSNKEDKLYLYKVNKYLKIYKKYLSNNY